MILLVAKYLLLGIKMFDDAYADRLFLRCAMVDISFFVSSGLPTSDTISNDQCPVGETLYAIYYQRLLILSDDVELNPGPVEETQQILNAISRMSDQIELVKREVVSANSELRSFKSELGDMKAAVSHGEKRQKELEYKVNTMEEKLDHVEYQNEILDSDMRALSLDYETKGEEINYLKKQLHYLESDKIRNNLRFFGLNEDADETIDSLKAKVKEEILDVAYPDGTGSGVILFAKRMGNKFEGKERMVLVKFNNFEVKLDSFKVRDQLRSKGIRLSSDLTSYQREQLDDVYRRGKSGYFKNGKLVLWSSDTEMNKSASSKSKTFKRKRTDLWGDCNQMEHEPGAGMSISNSL